MKTNLLKRFKQLFPFSWRDTGVALVILGAACVVTFLLKLFEQSDVFVPTVFVLAVFLIARFTTGYLYGVLGSLVSVVMVNFAFTYPYFAFDFTISGYPLTFLCMLATSILTSTLTTRIKRQEQIRAEAEKEKMRGNLLRAVSHDLRTPLTGIVGATSVVLENGDNLPPEKQRELLREVRDDAQWLVRMVENLLSVTRMSGGETRITKTEEAAEEIVAEAVRKFKKRFPDIKVSVSVPEELLFVPMDAMLIEQVIINLLENAAIHGMTADQIQVNVQKEKDAAVFSVEDNGKGISAEALGHLFDGYLSGEVSTQADSKRNMGIGLSACKSIIKAHNGHITAENIKTGGAVFRFAIPLREEHRDAG